MLSLDTIEVLPSRRPTVVTMGMNDEDVELAFGTSGESLRERLMLALIETLVMDAPHSLGASA